MQEYAHYFLPALSLLALGLWAGAYYTSPSLRAKQWLMASTLSAIPIVALSQLWWPWALTNVSLANFHPLLIVISISCFLGVITTLIRRLLQPSFNQPLDFAWGRYCVAVLGFVLISQVSTYLPWPKDVTAVAILSMIAMYALVAYFSLTKLYAYLSTAIAALTLIVICQLLFLEFSPDSTTWSWYIIDLATDAWDVAVLVMLAVAWPTLIGWWTKQKQQVL